MRREPDLAPLDFRHHGFHQAPEAWFVIELAQVRNLVRHDVIQYGRGREDEPPGERQTPRR